MTAFNPWGAAALALPWAFRDDIAEEHRSRELTGYTVEAVDGRIGKVDKATYESDSAGLVVDTGPWIFGKKALIPAGTINNIDPSECVVYVDRTKEQIKDAPEYDEARVHDPAYRESVGTYYTGTYR